MKIKRKRILKWISTIASELPEETYKAYHKYFEPRKEEAEDGKMVWRLGYLGTHPVNHKRRMMHLYDKFGRMGVEAYLMARDLKLVAPEDKQ